MKMHEWISKLKKKKITIIPCGLTTTGLNGVIYSILADALILEA